MYQLSTVIQWSHTSTVRILSDTRLMESWQLSGRFLSLIQHIALIFWENHGIYSDSMGYWDIPSGYLTQLWNMAHLQMIFPLKPSIDKGFSIAMLHNQMVMVYRCI